MTSQLLREMETALPAQFVPENAWNVFIDNTSAYICRAAVQHQRGRVFATSIRIPGLVADGSSEDEAMRRLSEAYKVAIIGASGSALRPIGEVSHEELFGAIDRTVLIDDRERRQAIAARIPCDDDLALIASESEPTE